MLFRPGRFTCDHGGHFAAHKASDLYVNDVREFFRTRRPMTGDARMAVDLHVGS